MKPAAVAIPIKLKQVNVLEEGGDIPAQLPEELHAAVADDLGGVVGTAEHAAAVAALLGGEQGVKAVLPIGRKQGRELQRQRLDARERPLELGVVERRVRADHEA